MQKLQELVSQLESYITQSSSSNSAISKSRVGWHIEHSLLTINMIVEHLKKSNPSDYKWTFNFGRILILVTKKIPRGRAQAPKVVQPVNDINEISLKANFELVRKNMSVLNTLNSDSYFKHPYFGKLNLNPTIQFLEIHTKHHLEIIKEIINDK